MLEKYSLILAIILFSNTMLRYEKNIIRIMQKEKKIKSGKQKLNLSVPFPFLSVSKA